MKRKIAILLFLSLIISLVGCGSKDVSTQSDSPTATPKETETVEDTPSVLNIDIGETTTTRDYEITLTWVELGKGEWHAFHHPQIQKNIGGTEKNDFLQVELVLKNIHKGDKGEKEIGGAFSDLEIYYDYDDGYRFTVYDGDYTGRSYCVGMNNLDANGYTEKGPSQFSDLTINPLSTYALSFYTYISTEEIITNTEAPLKIIIKLDDGSVLEYSYR